MLAARFLERLDTKSKLKKQQNRHTKPASARLPAAKMNTAADAKDSYVSDAQSTRELLEPEPCAHPWAPMLAMLSSQQRDQVSPASTGESSDASDESEEEGAKRPRRDATNLRTASPTHALPPGVPLVATACADPNAHGEIGDAGCTSHTSATSVMSDEQ